MSIRSKRDIICTEITYENWQKCYEKGDYLVRCKDCKHYQNEHICQYFSRFGTIETSAYAYCAYGERKGGDNE